MRSDGVRFSLVIRFRGLYVSFLQYLLAILNTRGSLGYNVHVNILLDFIDLLPPEEHFLNCFLNSV